MTSMNSFWNKCSCEMLFTHSLMEQWYLPAGINLCKVNNGNIRTMCYIYLKLIIKTQQRQHWNLPSVFFIVNFEQISHIVLTSPLVIFQQLNAGRARLYSPLLVLWSVQTTPRYLRMKCYQDLRGTYCTLADLLPLAASCEESKTRSP